MSFFDQRYYSMNKTHMILSGIWPYQPQYVRNIWPVTQLALTFSVIYFECVGVVKFWGDIDKAIIPLPPIMMVILNYTRLFNGALKSNETKLMLEKIEADWTRFKNTPAVVVLHRYAERGRFLTVAYTVYIYTSMSLYMAAPLLPIVLNIVNPLNESRPKDYLFETDYGFDTDPYYWPILVHGYMATILTISILVATDTLYVILVEHACALFEIVGFNMNLATVDYMAGRKRLISSHNDDDYQKICECINFHKHAVNFADMIENLHSGAFVAVFGIGTIIMSVTGVQALVQIEHTEVLLRLASFSIAEAFHLYFDSVTGQKLIDHSTRIRETAYQCQWYDFSLKAQRLLIPIMARSATPCALTAGKVYVISMENYSKIMQTAGSYFMAFSSLR